MSALPESNAGRFDASESRVLVKVLGFSLALTLVFTLVANTLPQVEGEAPVVEEVDLGALTMDSFVALGESIFNGKGTCTLCHNDRGRAPNIPAENMVETAKMRLASPRYHGKAKGAEAYLRESMRDPGAFVVKGFGKKGSNDTESPMPVVYKPPIQLSDVEIDAVIAYLEAKDGNEVTVPLPAEAPPPAAPAAVAAVPASTPQAVINKYGCASCHSVLGSEASVGPKLSSVGDRLTAEQIRQSILDPDAVIANGYPNGLMPQDFASRMTVSELEMLVRFLTQQKG